MKTKLKIVAILATLFCTMNVFATNYYDTGEYTCKIEKILEKTSPNEFMEQYLVVRLKECLDSNGQPVLVGSKVFTESALNAPYSLLKKLEKIQNLGLSAKFYANGLYDQRLLKLNGVKVGPIWPNQERLIRIHDRYPVSINSSNNSSVELAETVHFTQVFLKGSDSVVFNGVDDTTMSLHVYKEAGGCSTFKHRPNSCGGTEVVIEFKAVRPLGTIASLEKYKFSKTDSEALYSKFDLDSTKPMNLEFYSSRIKCLNSSNCVFIPTNF